MKSDFHVVIMNSWSVLLMSFAVFVIVAPVKVFISYLIGETVRSISAFTDIIEKNEKERRNII